MGTASVDVEAREVVTLGVGGISYKVFSQLHIFGVRELVHYAYGVPAPRRAGMENGVPEQKRHSH